MTRPLLGLLDNAKDAIVEFLNNCLLVAGGFLVGYLLGGVLGWVIGKYIFRQQSPAVFQKVGRPVGGALLALIVALIVFTGRGKSPGDGGDGKGSNTTEPNAEKKADPKIDPKLPPIKLPDAKQPDVTIWVTILEGAAIPGPGKFYRVDEEDTAKTLEELKTALLERKAREHGKVVLVIRFQSNTRPGDPRLLTDVTNWATTTAGLDVILRAN